MTVAAGTTKVETGVTVEIKNVGGTVTMTLREDDDGRMVIRMMTRSTVIIIVRAIRLWKLMRAKHRHQNRTMTTH